MLLIVLISITFSSCYMYTKPDDDATQRQYANYRVIELTLVSKSGGFAVNINAQKIEKLGGVIVTPEFLYIKSLDHYVDAKDVIIDHFFQDSIPDFSKCKNKGFIKFDSNSLEISIERPQYSQNDSVFGYVPYEYNGKYKLTTIQDTIPSKDEYQYYWSHGVSSEEYLMKFGKKNIF
ncbi:MAG: hypothetical protein WCK02_04985 [Bacteroidota bacterium]